MPELLTLCLWNLALVAGLMLLLWGLSLALRNASIVDPFWGCGFVIVAWATVGQTQPVTRVGWLLAGLVTLWGLRLSGYLLWRNHGEAEDRRYAGMRQHHGPRFWWVSLLTVFALQGLILWFVSLTVQVGIASGGESLKWWNVAGIAVWAVGLFFETVGDWQMARFKARPDSQGQVMDRGLWRYTRHPNYFGDFCVWWGLYLVSLPAAWWTLGGPLLMSFLLLKISGVSLLEKDIADRRPEYRAYKRRTSAFFPAPPKSAE